MNANGRSYDETRRYTVFKVGVLMLLAILVGLTQWQVEGVESPARFDIPTPLPTIAPTVVVLTTPTLLLDSSAPLIVRHSITLRGRGTPDHVISVRRAGVEQGKAVVDENGDWSYEVQLETVGQAAWTAIATDGAGRVSAESQPLLLAVLPEPTAPTLDIPAIADDFAGGDVLLTGSADAGSVVSILVNERIFDVVSADAEGQWRYTLPLADAGTYRITVQLIDASIERILSSEMIEITVFVP